MDGRPADRRRLSAQHLLRGSRAAEQPGGAADAPRRQRVLRAPLLPPHRRPQPPHRQEPRAPHALHRGAQRKSSEHFVLHGYRHYSSN